MPLTMRPTGLASPAYADWEDWTVLDDGRVAGRIYEVTPIWVETPDLARPA